MINLQAEKTETVSQKDFVPTISLMLGVPIPFSNLGRVIIDLFTHCSTWKTGSSPIKQVGHTMMFCGLSQIGHNRTELLKC